MRLQARNPPACPGAPGRYARRKELLQERIETAVLRVRSRPPETLARTIDSVLALEELDELLKASYDLEQRLSDAFDEEEGLQYAEGQERWGVGEVMYDV